MAIHKFHKEGGSSNNCPECRRMMQEQKNPKRGLDKRKVKR